MPNKAEKKDAIRPLSDDEETFTFDRSLLAPSGAQVVRICKDFGVIRVEDIIIDGFKKARGWPQKI